MSMENYSSLTIKYKECMKVKKSKVRSVFYRMFLREFIDNHLHLRISGVIKVLIELTCETNSESLINFSNQPNPLPI